LVRTHRPVVQDFHHDEHALTDLLSDTLGMAPLCCPACSPAKPAQHREAVCAPEQA
jgi:hypothetical protein